MPQVVPFIKAAGVVIVFILLGKLLEERAKANTSSAIKKLMGLQPKTVFRVRDNGALEEMYGPRGGRGLALRAGRATFSDALRNFGALVGAADLAFVVLPLQSKLRIGLPAFAKIFTQLSDQQTTVEEKDTEWIWTIHKCPCCWGRTGADKPVCFVAAGLLQESLKWVSGGNEFRVNESKCVAIGDSICEFIVQKEPIS